MVMTLHLKLQHQPMSGARPGSPVKSRARGMRRSGRKLVRSRALFGPTATATAKETVDAQYVPGLGAFAGAADAALSSRFMSWPALAKPTPDPQVNDGEQSHSETLS